MTQGALRCVTWSKWVKVLTPTLPVDKTKSKFQKCRTQNGFTLKEWFDKGFEVPALYEFAVQYNGKGRSTKRYVVYYRISRAGFQRNGHWSTNLLRHKTVRDEVNRVLEQDCSILVRRGTVPGRDILKKKEKLIKVSDYLCDHFDYAWKKYIWRKLKDGEIRHRKVVSKNGKIFSTDQV